MSLETAGGHTRDHPVTVNGHTNTVAAEEISFEELLALAFTPVPAGLSWVFTVTYRGGPAGPPEGSLAPGSTVKVRDWMAFHVTKSDSSAV